MSKSEKNEGSGTSDESEQDLDWDDGHFDLDRDYGLSEERRQHSENDSASLEEENVDWLSFAEMEQELEYIKTALSEDEQTDEAERNKEQSSSSVKFSDNSLLVKDVSPGCTVNVAVPGSSGGAKSKTSGTGAVKRSKCSKDVSKQKEHEDSKEEDSEDEVELKYVASYGWITRDNRDTNISEIKFQSSEEEIKLEAKRKTQIPARPKMKLYSMDEYDCCSNTGAIGPDPEIKIHVPTPKLPSVVDILKSTEVTMTALHFEFSVDYPKKLNEFLNSRPLSDDRVIICNFLLSNSLMMSAFFSKMAETFLIFKNTIEREEVSLTTDKKDVENVVSALKKLMLVCQFYSTGWSRVVSHCINCENKTDNTVTRNKLSTNNAQHLRNVLDDLTNLTLLLKVSHSQLDIIPKFCMYQSAGENSDLAVKIRESTPNVQTEAHKGITSLSNLLSLITSEICIIEGLIFAMDDLLLI
ncbi:uncharacterized protein [Periplaneta americana]|uniref:uncharacterized protein isoform X2 n=1 Tax=Periplaneta americana TaxID=6978 RepID=UPI0037E8036B